MIAILTDPGVGGTFLTWSLHYLAGHKKYYHAESTQWRDITDDPVTSKNAHGFAPNQPVSKVMFDSIHAELQAQWVDTFHTMYLHNFNGVPTAHDEDLKNAIASLAADKIILLTLPKDFRLYQYSYRRRSGHTPSWHDPLIKLTSDADRLEDFIVYFFRDSYQKWKDLKLVNIWDLREFLALNLDIHHTISIDVNMDPALPTYTLAATDLWNTFDQTVDDLFSYLEIDIDQARREHWNKIYKKWRYLHYDKMLFVFYFNTIIEYIISGKDFDLTKFDLDIVQEATIQNQLIYQHNLNLKTWQLEKFTNTNQLHQLLEPNIHTANA